MKLREWEASIAMLEKCAIKNAPLLVDAKKSRDALTKSIPKLRIMQNSPERQPTHVLARGDFRRKGDPVQPGVPAALLPELPEEATPRLALAEWLNDPNNPNNPLPARVVVNRFWAMLFGTGIVATAEDFGSQGDWPSHPELLDWLAVEFVESGWDIKHMLSLIVTSSSYRQSSAGSEHLAQRDPANRLLTRGPRNRLSAEMIRDNALAVSGLLQERSGGSSVRPYQPAGLWMEMSYGNGAGKAYKQDHGDNLYRRGLYTFWKRSILYPSLAAFDAPIPEECTVSRPVTNTALQAFVTLNDVAFVESARVFAARIIQEGGTSTDSRIRFAMEAALARPPSASEHSILDTLLQDMVTHYAFNANAVTKIISAGEWTVANDIDSVTLAAWTSVAQAIMNLDESLTKG